jgi:aspartyl-tRNA(Asn)/glutamyl-tRNA(Gln) amidotransferase subunit A
MSGLVGAGAAELRRRVASREVSCEEVARVHLDAIARLEPVLGAFLAVLDGRAIETARALDRRIAAGEPPPPLAGVPVAVKDVLNIEGLPTTCGSRVLEGYRPPFTATAIERLEAAGAIVVGKTNMDEFAMGSSTETSAYKPTRNPWDTARVPGGSSGGSAAAVAARLAPLALGTDTGGSIRQPAAFCGVVGLKPTYGRVSRYGLVAFGSSLDQVGPFARTVEDAALAAAPLFGRDPRDATSLDRPVGDLASALVRGVGGLRVVSAGAVLVDVELPHLHHAVATYYLVATAEASSNLARYDGVRYGRREGGDSDLRSMYGRTRDAGFGPEVKRRIILGTFALSSGYYDAYYLRAQKVRALIRRDFDREFGRCDVVATPTTPSPAFRLGDKTSDPLQMYLEDIFTVPANLAGLPALSLPCGLAAGLPVGLQLLGRPFDEETLLRAGAAYQARTRHHEAAPPVCAT